MFESCSITFPKWVKSLRTVCKASDLEAAVNNAPAYLPAGLSAIAGALCPEFQKNNLRLTELLVE